MPFLPRSIGPGETLGVSSDAIRQLHHELAANGFPVSSTEVSAAHFGSDTESRVREFQSRHDLATTGALDPATGGVLALSTLVTTENDRTKLRAELKDAVNKVPDSPEYNYWLARSALIAGDYALAASISPELIDLSGLNVDLGNAILTDGDGVGAPRQPEVPFPENFYSYRNSLMLEEDITSLRIKAPSGGMPRLARASTTPVALGDPPPSPPPPGLPDPPPATGSGLTRPQQLTASALAILNAIEAWQLGNSEFGRQRYAGAVQAYDRCQQAVLDYFGVFPDYNLSFTTNILAARVDELVWRISSDQVAWADVWQLVNMRRQLLSLAEIGQFDWNPIDSTTTAYLLLQGNLKGQEQPDTPFSGTLDPRFRKEVIDSRLLVIGGVLVPLARGEANRLRRQYTEAREDFTRVLRRSIPIPNDTTLKLTVSLLCEFIEVPFARLLLLETMLDQAEAQYKSRLSGDAETDSATKAQELARIGQIAQDFVTGNIPGDATPGALPLQHLVAAITYADAIATIEDDGEYVARTKQALKTLNDNVNSTLSGGDASSMAFQALGQSVTLPTVSGVGGSLPGLTSGTHPHEAYLEFNSPDGQPMRECNPRVYALLLQAQSRLLQIWNGFNYLGYRDDYVPPWRFPYLLDRARYFSEHAKNAQRDYLNFLNNAENEEYKELSASQNVELEKANVQIETARVDQAAKEVAASKESVMQAQVNMDDAQKRVDNYSTFDQEMSLFEDISIVSSIVGTVTGSGPNLADVATGIDKAWAERDLEKKNLQLAVGEAEQAGKVALAQLAVTKAGLVVAGLQRQAALLRHEFALQNLQFMRNQTLNTEQWYRLVGAIRSVSDTYLRYGIEMSFLAQQAYNFESDKRLNIIRFDYDLSDVGAMLAADFLLRDLDTLEQDLVVSQQTRQQQVRYVLSMAREFPDTLRTLSDNGEVTFSMRLEQLERHFPGLFNLRISSVDLQPVALMDPTRVSVELTHLGAGTLRLKAQPGTSPLNNTDLAADGDWLPDAATDWPVKIHVLGPDTNLFSGLSRQEAASLSSITANERTAFEGLPAASSWKIDMSMKENQIVPGTLSDVLIIFTLSGYYDSALKDAVVNAASAQRPFATTSFISARRTLPDAYYSLTHYGKLDWDVPERMLTLVGTPSELHNVAVFLPLLPNGPELGRCYCRYPVRLDVSSGAVNILSALPEFTLVPNGLVLTGTFTGSASTQVAWDFGDNTPLVQTSTAQHIYTRPGRYTIVARLVKDGSLLEYRSAVVVSANHQVIAPLIIAPEFSASTALPDGTVTLTVSPPTGVTDVSIDCSAGRIRGWADTGPLTLKLKPGTYTLDFLAMRNLSARFYSRQRYLPATPVSLSRGRVSTNRTFDPSTGANTTTSPNPLATQLFGDGSITISPVDRWTLELQIAENPWFTTVSPSDIAEFDGSELDDAVIELEYLVLEKS